MHNDCRVWAAGVSNDDLTAAFPNLSSTQLSQVRNRLGDILGDFDADNLNPMYQFFRNGLEGLDDAAKQAIVISRLQAVNAVKNTSLVENVYWLGRISRWYEQGLDFTFTQNGAITRLIKNGTHVADIGSNSFKFKYSGFGGDLPCPLDKTTTVIGLYTPTPSTGTKWFIDIGIYKGGMPPNNSNPGGLCILNLPPGQYTEQKNWDWLIHAANRGDNIRLVSDPANPATIWKNGIPPGQSGHNGLKTVTGKEIDILENHILENQLGYVFDPVTSTYKLP